MEPTISEHAPEEYFAPWQPAIGTRVRVELSPECPHARINYPYEGEPEVLPGRGHCAGEEGRAGTVVATRQGIPQRHGHTVRVQFDEPLLVAGYGYFLWGMYAPCELVPLEEADAS